MPKSARADACDAGPLSNCNYFGPASNSESSAAAQGRDRRAEGFTRDLLDAGAVDLQTDGGPPHEHGARA